MYFKIVQTELMHILILLTRANISLYMSTSLFQANMKFPADYPYSPPSVRFITKVWHPNVYEVKRVK